MNAPNQALRVAVLSTVPQTIAAFLEKQLEHLCAKGFEIHVISSPGADLDRLGRGLPLHRHGIPMERQPHPLRDLQSLLRIYAAMRKIRPQVVHAHTPKAGLLGMMAAKLAGVPVRLYTLHGLPLETRTGRLRQLLESVERLSSYCATQTYSVSRSLQQRVLELGLCPADKMSILGDGSCAGVNLHRFENTKQKQMRDKWQVPADATVAAFVGRLSRDKGIEVLAQAWPEIAARNPLLHLVLAGELDHTDPVSAEALHLLSNDPRIHLIGSLDSTQMPAFYAELDFLVIPSFREGLCQVALECAAAGLPIVASRVCGLVDSVADGISGILVPAREPIALAEAVTRLASNPSLRLHLGQGAKAYVSKHFDENRVNQLWINEYQRLVQESFPNFALATVGAKT